SPAAGASAHKREATSAAGRPPERTAPARNPGPSAGVSVPAQWMGPSARPRAWRHRGRWATWREFLSTPTVIDIVDRLQCFVAEQCGEALKRAFPTLIGGEPVERGGRDKTQENPRP